MFTNWRPAAALFALVLVAAGLAGCRDEPAERKAFMEFLQARIIAKPGLHIPIMSAEDVKKFGPYADQYRIMSGFHTVMDKTISEDLARALQAGMPRSIEEVADRRAIFPIVREGMARFKAEVEQAQSKADAAHAALQQPPDLKSVYDIAYGRMVTKPAVVFLELVPSILNSLPAVEALAAFLDENRNAIEYHFSTPMSKDTLIQSRLMKLMDAARDSAKASEEGKRKLRALVEGK
jgi:hypothetical protein